MEDIATLQGRLGYEFKNPELLRLALTHPSRAHESGGGVEHNQRLEFLGDAVLQLIITHALYERFSGFDEGLLTKTRASLVNKRALAAQGRNLRLGECVSLSPGEEAQGGRDRDSIQADTFEAVLGALFLDGGLEAAGEFLLRRFSGMFGELDSQPQRDNPKGELQETLQARTGEAPKYQIVSVSGPDHDRRFECTVHHQGVELARGRGTSKKAAESDAAQTALEKIRIPPESQP